MNARRQDGDQGSRADIRTAREYLDRIQKQNTIKKYDEMRFIEGFEYNVRVSIW
jgi:hypothetical protein